MPKVITDPTLPTDPAALSHVEKIAAGLIDRLDRAELGKLAELLSTAARAKPAPVEPAPSHYTSVRVIPPTAEELAPRFVTISTNRS